MSDQLPEPPKDTPLTLDYSYRSPSGKRFSWLRVLLILFLVILGIGALIFGICTIGLIYH
jgi:hypothetical protein